MEEDGYWCQMPVAEDRIHRPSPVLHEGNCSLEYNWLGINAARKVTRRDPSITPPSARALEQIVAAAAAVKAGVFAINSEHNAEPSTSIVGPNVLTASDEELLRSSSEEEEENKDAEKAKPSSSYDSSEKEMAGPGRRRLRRVVVDPGEFPEEEVQQRTPPVLTESPRHTAEDFTAEIQREIDALIVQHSKDDDVQILSRRPDDFKEVDERVEGPRSFDIPSSAGHSFKTFQSGEMGFEATPMIVVPEAIKDSLHLHRDSSIELFGDLSSVSELERVERWSIRAAAGVTEPLVVHNNVLAAGLNEEIRLKAEEAENRARLYELKCKKAEEESSANLSRMKEEYGAVDILSFKARIEEKMKIEAKTRQALAEDLEMERANHEAETQRLISHLDAKDSDLSSMSSGLQELKDQLAAQIEEDAKAKEEAEKAKAYLSAANDLLKVEEWAAVLNHPKMRVAHPAEDTYLVRLAEAEAEEDGAEDGDAAREIDIVHPVSSSAVETLKAPNSDPANAEA
ncbi:uncharacterized protein LOC110721308 [Chenopodium quinoa]|uniref:uncharacterized protein LOC110721308 n=1 Tax=Chenopodium quinoa TaxID=63459 RepID=UPI000B778E22|nr:uncharacterized protein LOC110721308 [Chenopodium quinoa]